MEEPELSFIFIVVSWFALHTVGVSKSYASFFKIMRADKVNSNKIS